MLLRARFAATAKACPEDADFLQSDADHSGSSSRFERFTLLVAPPRVDKNETTDKGYINQNAVLTHRADIVNKLYADTPTDDVVVLNA